MKALAADDGRILIVVPTLGTRLATLTRTLRSIGAQRGVDVDVVVVAPSATPALVQLTSDSAARLVTDPGHISAAVNRGLREAGASHRYAGWIGDDDLLRPGALATLAALLAACRDAVVAYGGCDYVDIDGRTLFTRNPPPGADHWLQVVPGLIKQEACLFRIDALRRAGGLDETLRFTMDLDLLLRLRRLGEFARTDAVVAGFCWHADSLTIANRERSLAEAQRVQRRLATGWMRAVNPWLQPLVRKAVLAVSARINRRWLPRA